jgi:hypothetical protein
LQYRIHVSSALSDIGFKQPQAPEAVNNTYNNEKYAPVVAVFSVPHEERKEKY